VDITTKTFSSKTTHFSGFVAGIAPNSTVTFTLRSSSGSASQNAKWAAYQIEGGAWQPMSGNAGKYSFDIKGFDVRYRVLWVCEDQPGSSTNVAMNIQLVTTGESKQLSSYGCYSPPINTDPPPTVSLSGTINGLSEGEHYAISPLQVYGQAEVGSTSSTYATQALKGTYDLFTSKRLTKTNKFIIARDVRVDADTVRDFDFAGPEAFVPNYYKIDL
jgi:hypothetical protein